LLSGPVHVARLLRSSGVFNRGGEKISAEEIENIILSHPSVKDVACIPVADPDLGERVCACVLLREGASMGFDELKAFLLGKEIAKYKFPERLEILTDFPLSSVGKVSKTKLVEMISQKIAIEQQAQSSTCS
jgi:2,3-dihydroxybenzoate-AMP ligase